MIIYITGIDGSGKSTITKTLEKEIIQGDVKTIWARYKPQIVKVLITPFKRRFVKDPQKDYLMDSKEYSKWISYKSRFTKSNILSKSIFLLQSLDYSIQLIKYQRVINKKSGTVIIDRYLLDFIVDQSVNYGDISKHLITRLFLKRLKRFDYIFYIDAEEKIAFGRKDDIPSLQYLTQRRKYYLQYISQLPNGHIVANNTDISVAINEIQAKLSSNQN